MVYPAIASGSAMRSSGSQAGPGPSGGWRRVTATSMPSRGFIDDTLQSLPKATTAPAATTLPIG